MMILDCQDQSFEQNFVLIKYLQIYV